MLIGSSDSAEIARIILLTEFSCFQLLLQIKHQASFETKLQFVETGKGGLLSRIADGPSVMDPVWEARFVKFKLISNSSTKL